MKFKMMWNFLLPVYTIYLKKIKQIFINLLNRAMTGKPSTQIQAKRVEKPHQTNKKSIRKTTDLL